MNITQSILQTLDESLENITSLDQLDSLHTKYLGRNGKINELLKDLKNIPSEEKKEYGQQVNELKQSIITLIDKKRSIILNDKTGKKIDVTLPGHEYTKGSLHPVTYAIEEISGIFEKIGFIRMSYPEIDWEFFSFEALNMPSDHPARDDFETFFIKQTPHKKFGKMVLTPHTSNGQIREMMRLGKPPMRMINIGKTYRPNWDASHVPMFHQFEGLCIDKRINITHLKGTIEYFAKAYFGEDREIRLRPFHFQFTEPSFEVDITCDICKGTGYVKKSEILSSKSETNSKIIVQNSKSQTKCRLCKAGWLELGGTGMIHPNVLKAGGIDSDEYTGWAFGFGIERVMMMKPNVGLSNVRVLYDGDVRVLEQF
ncbi:MAG: phenylalanine--tRNA ligase subunit alpha [bacterium]|nr:phenylalanine--tRNA ligase subunit alpha [bacterium]